MADGGLNEHRKGRRCVWLAATNGLALGSGLGTHCNRKRRLNAAVLRARLLLSPHKSHLDSWLLPGYVPAGLPGYYLVTTWLLPSRSLCSGRPLFELYIAPGGPAELARYALILVTCKCVISTN